MAATAALNGPDECIREMRAFYKRRPDVAVAPGISFGEHGDDYVRIALVENEQRIRQAARNIRKFFDTADQTLHNVAPMARTG